MTPTPEDLIRHAPGRMRERAQALRGHVTHRERQDETVRARVRGSRPAPYRVRIDLHSGEVVCSCPDDLNAICKHACATLLVLRDDPASFLTGPLLRRLPVVTGWADADVERRLGHLRDLYPEVVGDWARQGAQEDEEEWGKVTARAGGCVMAGCEPSAPP